MIADRVSFRRRSVEDVISILNVAAASALSAFFDVVALFVVVVRARDVERRALGERVQRREQDETRPRSTTSLVLPLLSRRARSLQVRSTVSLPRRQSASALSRSRARSTQENTRAHASTVLASNTCSAATNTEPGSATPDSESASARSRHRSRRDSDGWMMMFGSIIIIVRVVVVARGRAGSGLASALRLLLHHPLRQPTQRVLHQRAGVRPGRVARNALVVQDHVFQPERALERGERARGHGLASAYDGVQAGLHVRALALEQGGHGGGGRRTARLGRTPPRRDRQWRPRARRRKVSMRRARGNHVAVRRKRRERR